MAFPILPLAIGAALVLFASAKPSGRSRYGSSKKPSGSGYPKNYIEVLSLPEGQSPQQYMDELEPWVDAAPGGALFVEVSPDIDLALVRGLLVDAAKQYPDTRFGMVASAIVDPLHDHPADSYIYMPKGMPPIKGGYISSLPQTISQLGPARASLSKNVPNFYDFRGSEYSEGFLEAVGAASTVNPKSVVVSAGDALDMDQARAVLRYAAALNPDTSFLLIPGDLGAQLRGSDPQGANTYLFAGRTNPADGTQTTTFEASGAVPVLGENFYDALESLWI